MQIHRFWAAICVLPLIIGAAHAQTREDVIVRQSTAVLQEIMAIPAWHIPQSMLAEAEGLVIIPNMLKGGFVVGVRHGNGVVLMRDEHGVWQPPQFVTMTGGNIGWQVGIQSTDLILAFMTPKSVQDLLRGKFTLGADAAVAAGPVGRQAAAATDTHLKSEIYSWSRSRGLFAGVSIDGSVLQINPVANANYYRAVRPDTAALPATAANLLAVLSHFSAAPAGSATSHSPFAAGEPAPPAYQTLPPDAQRKSASPRESLVDASIQLMGRLDEKWQRFLALPEEIYTPSAQPRQDALQMAYRRYDRVARDPKYAELKNLPEFQATYRLLGTYMASIVPAGDRKLQLPAPPAVTDATINADQ